MDTDTEIAPQNSYRPFSLDLPKRETEVVAPILDATMASVTPETTDVDRGNVVAETRDIAISTPIPRKSGRSRFCTTIASYVMNGVNSETNMVY